MARSSIGLGCQPLTLARRVRFPHGLLNMTMWWNWQTRDGQNVVPLRRGSSTLPMVTETLQARQVPNWLSYGRFARLDTGACNSRVGEAQPGLISLDSGVQLPDPPLMTGYANWHSGEVESLVPVGSIPTSVTDKEHDPVVQGQRRLGDNQESAGSIPAGITDVNWSVGVLAAHLRGKEEDPVQLRDGPLVQRAGMFPGGD